MRPRPDVYFNAAPQLIAELHASAQCSGLHGMSGPHTTTRRAGKRRQDLVTVVLTGVPGEIATPRARSARVIAPALELALHWIPTVNTWRYRRGQKKNVRWRIDEAAGAWKYYHRFSYAHGQLIASRNFPVICGTRADADRPMPSPRGAAGPAVTPCAYSGRETEGSALGDRA